MNARSPAVLAEKLTKRIGNRSILDGIDLVLQTGEFLSVFGPNGAGKTTLLRVLSGLVKPSSGTVCIFGLPLTEDNAVIRRRYGVISHRSFLYETLTAYENLLFYGKMYNVPRLDEQVGKVLEEVGLSFSMHDPVRTFSRGMLQRLSIARAILHDPDLLFLDEPFTGLDQQAAGMLSTLLGRYRNRERSIIMITHDFGQGLEMSDRYVILSRGSIVSQGESRGLGQAELARIYRDAVEGADPWHS